MWRSRHSHSDTSCLPVSITHTCFYTRHPKASPLAPSHSSSSSEFSGRAGQPSLHQFIITITQLWSIMMILHEWFFWVRSNCVIPVGREKRRNHFLCRGKWPNSDTLYETEKLIHINPKYKTNRPLFCHLREDVWRLLTRQKNPALLPQAPASCFLLAHKTELCEYTKKVKEKVTATRRKCVFRSRHVFPRQ